MEKVLSKPILPMAPTQFYTSNFDFHFKIEIPSIKPKDPTGSGDAFTAGIAYAWHNNLTFEESVLFAAKLGILNASKFEVCNITFNEINNFKLEPKIFPIGKQIKTTDAPA